MDYHLFTSYQLNPTLNFEDLQRFIQEFYFFLSFYEMGFDVNPKYFRLKKFKSTLDKYHRDLPVPLSDMLKDPAIWNDYFDQGEKSVKQNTVFNHPLFIVFFILESKIEFASYHSISLKYEVLSDLSDHIESCNQLMKTMVEDPNLLSFSESVLYALDTQELAQLYYSVNRLRQLLTTEPRFCSYEEAFYSISDKSGGRKSLCLVDEERGDAFFDIQNFFRYPRIRKVWMMYKLCINLRYYKYYSQWLTFFKAVYRWFMKQSEKLRKILYPSKSYHDFVLESLRYSYDHLELVKKGFVILYVMMDFRYPKALVNSYGNAAILKILKPTKPFNCFERREKEKWILIVYKLSRNHLGKRMLLFDFLVNNNFEYASENHVNVLRQLRYITQRLGNMEDFPFETSHLDFSRIWGKPNSLILRYRAYLLEWFNISEVSHFMSRDVIEDEPKGLLIDYEKSLHLLSPNERELFSMLFAIKDTQCLFPSKHESLMFENTIRGHMFQMKAYAEYHLGDRKMYRYYDRTYPMF